MLYCFPIYIKIYKINIKVLQEFYNFLSDIQIFLVLVKHIKANITKGMFV